MTSPTSFKPGPLAGLRVIELGTLGGVSRGEGEGSVVLAEFGESPPGVANGRDQRRKVGVARCPRQQGAGELLVRRGVSAVVTTPMSPHPICHDARVSTHR